MGKKLKQTEKPKDLSGEFGRLKKKQRLIRSGFPDNTGLRIHRALSWLQRAEMAGDDKDAAFIFYWIAFNAAYADETTQWEQGEREGFGHYFKAVLNLDKAKVIHAVLWKQFSGVIKQFLNNEYVYQPYWNHLNRVPGYDDWRARFEASQRVVHNALMKSDTQVILSVLFDRMYVLRNQLLHGGATWNSSSNREQVRDACNLMACLIPVSIEIMMDNPHEDWGAPHYPPVEN